MRKAVGVVAVAVLAGMVGCGGSGRNVAGMEGLMEGGSTPDGAVETFLEAARESQALKNAGELTQAGRAYQRMAAVFGTQRGSIRRSYPATEVRDRMIVLAACLRPDRFRITSQPDPRAYDNEQTVVTAEITRDSDTISLPFRVVLGGDDRWYIEQIQLSTSSFSC